MKYKCIIVDDEYPARKLLTSYVEKFDDLELVGDCKNPLEAMKILNREEIDLMLLDIQMPELSGIEFLQVLKKKPIVIFTTAYPDYAIEGYQLDVIDYMLKPISFERFTKGINKAINHIELIKSSKTIVRTELSENLDRKWIAIKVDYKIVKINLCDLKYIEGLKEYVTFYTKTGKYINLESLKNLEEKLPSTRFIRIHKSYIANTDFIDALEGNMVHVDKTQLPIGKSYREFVVGKIFPKK